MSQVTHDTQPVAANETTSAPASPAVDLLTDHAYDGIQEYDNPMPGWWKWLFVATIVFSAGYYTLSIVNGGPLSPVTVFEQARAEEMRLQNAKPLSESGSALLAYSRDEKVRSAGAAVFAANCALCHKPDGGGQVGPNLTDEVYINIKAIEDIPKLVRSGAKNGAMPSFARLPSNDIIRAAAFVASLRGKNVPGGKIAEGVAIPPWGSSAPASRPATAPATTPTSPR